MFKNYFFFRFSLFQSQSWLWELTAAIFRESAGYVRLTDFRLIHLTFRPQKRDKLVKPIGHYGLLELFVLLGSVCTFCRNCFGDINSLCEGRILEFDHLIDPSLPPLSPSPLQRVSLNLI